MGRIKWTAIVFLVVFGIAATATHGPFSVKNGTTSQGYIDFFEDADNGTNRVRLQAPASAAADYTVTFQSASGTVGFYSAPSYASIYASSQTVTVTTADTYYIASKNWVQNEQSGAATAYNSTTGAFTIQNNGIYELSYTLSFGAGNNETIHCGVFIDGTIDPAFSVQRKLGATGSDIGNMGGGNLLTHNTGGAAIDLRCTNDGTTDIDIQHGAMWIKRITE